MSTENLNPYIDFYTVNGDRIDNDEIGDHSLTKGLVGFSGAKPKPAELLSFLEMKAVSAWLRFLAADNEVSAEVTDQLLDMFKGYPAGTTMGEIVSGTAKKTLSAVED